MSWSIPDGYELLSPCESGVTVVVSGPSRSTMQRAGIQNPENLSAGPSVSEWVGGGRVRHPVIHIDNEPWLLKAYRRGGVLARWNPDRYWRPGRFLRELETAGRAVHAGVPAAKPIALVLRPAGWGGAFRAWQLVRYIPGVRSLRDLLQGDQQDNGLKGDGQGRALPKGLIFRAAGEAVRKMHEAGIDHPDLNIGNILARPLINNGDGQGSTSVGAEAFIVDWDRARMRPAGSWNPHRNLLRLWRSAVKQARLSHRAPPPNQVALKAFLRGYFGNNRAGLRALRRYIRSRLVFLALHAVYWNLARIGRMR